MKRDDLIFDIIEKEHQRQLKGIELIASENFVSDQVMEAMGSCLTNKYAEGYPGKRYYGGCEVVDQSEQIAIDRIKEIFGAEWANVQPHSGAQANAAVFLAVLNPGDKFMGLNLAHGGHLSHGSLVNTSGIIYTPCEYNLNKETSKLCPNGRGLGLNYYNQESDFSASLVARNLGGQLKAFEERHEKLPVDVQLGFSKRLSHAPFRLSLTLHDLTHWSASTTAANNFGKKLLNHIALGIDFLPTNNFYLAAGYNFRRGEEMKINGSSHWAGFTCGTGIQLKRLKLGMAYAKYHVSSSSLIFNLSYTL